MTLILGSEDVRRCVNIPSLVTVVETALRESARGAVVQTERLNLRYGESFFRMMPALLNESRLMGYKVFHGSGKTGVRYLLALYDQDEGSLLALMDAHYLTAARTGAATGVATRYLSRPDSSRVAVFGSGLEARTNFEAVCAVRQVKSAKVYSTNPERRKGFAGEMTRLQGLPVEPVDSPEACADGADIVIVATNTMGRPSQIAFEGRWMRPGMHVNSIGSTAAFLREIDAETFGRADVIAVDAPPAQIELESGDVMDALQSALYRRERVVEIQSVLAGTAAGRSRPEDITLYKSVGSAMQDVVSGYAVFLEATRRSLGIDVGDFLEKKFVI